MICLRCGCEIQPGELLANKLRTSAMKYEYLGAVLEGYEIDQHRSADDCMVALRRKEIELAAKRSEEHETQ